ERSRRALRGRGARAGRRAAVGASRVGRALPRDRAGYHRARRRGRAVRPGPLRAAAGGRVAQPVARPAARHRDGDGGARPPGARRGHLGAPRARRAGHPGDGRLRRPRLRPSRSPPGRQHRGLRPRLRPGPRKLRHRAAAFRLARHGGGDRGARHPPPGGELERPTRAPLAPLRPRRLRRVLRGGAGGARGRPSGPRAPHRQHPHRPARRHRRPRPGTGPPRGADHRLFTLHPVRRAGLLLAPRRVPRPADGGRRREGL
ncbi:MAG: FIG00003370: Multicopper polyphenol oxidase, partial [uncultured Gemmatimonadetes bacterium]